MKQRKPRKRDKVLPLYTTYALASTKEVDPDTNVGKPTEKGVIDAKNWVDHNQK